MAKKLYSATEIAQMRLPGLPTSRDNIRARAEREGWYSEEATGQGGTRRIYEIPARYLAQGADGEISEEATSKVAGTIAAGEEADVKLVELAVRALEEWLQARGLQLEPERKSAIVAVLYKYLRARKDASMEDIEQFLRAIAA